MMDSDAPKPLDLETARKIIDFSGGQEALKDLAENQLRGAVALYNHVNDPDCKLGYLADEVGMGKTYIALGVVALMRYFNPRLRVLYICPSRNVQDKWQREYQSFISKNVETAQFRIRTPDGKPAAPFINCNDLSSLLAAVTTGHFADIFVRKDSFSLSMSEQELTAGVKNPYLEDLVKLQQWVPALRAESHLTTDFSGLDVDKLSGELKDEAKEFHAQVLNRALPDFDLIVVDEAHNFKHHFDNSYRNRVMSWILGTHDNPIGTVNKQPIVLKKHVNRVLLLSATPYDRNIDQLQNQLAMFGRQALMSDINPDSKQSVVSGLRRFMVRRLNTIQLNGGPHSRNQYRIEHRSGPQAEIELGSDEQKLITALVQKKVGDVIGRHRSSSSFQVGMLASFESYADGAGETVLFDGDPDDKNSTDAEDRHLIHQLRRSWQDHKLGDSLPHPKMDDVANRLAEQMFQLNRKQLVFVRRVKSVGELKAKLDSQYDRWLKEYLREKTDQDTKARRSIDQVIQAYETVRKPANSVIDEEAPETDDDEEKRSLKPKEDNLFTWFFRGDKPESLSDLDLTPDNIARSFIAPNQRTSTLLEINWAELLRKSPSSDPALDWRQSPGTLQRIAEHTRFRRTNKGIEDIADTDYLEQFQSVQLAFLDAVSQSTDNPSLKNIKAFMTQTSRMTWQADAAPMSPEETRAWLEVRTLFDMWQDRSLLSTLFGSLATMLEGTTNADDSALRRLEAHRQLLVLLLRNGHGIIDLYVARLLLGSSDLNEDRRMQWMEGFTDLLQQQKRQHKDGGVSTWAELAGLSSELDAIIKANVPGVLQDRQPQEFRTYLTHTLTPLAPVIGASGETGSGIQRSNQARKFRMPGYPLALISTDVFQEGEDLHLFCDSVMHYGLSASPVSIEQKTGRVDRVGALSHRNLAEFKQDEPPEEALIQVSFPHVRESIEYLQVRQTCESINQFINSLDKEINPLGETEHEIDSSEQVRNYNPVPPQISRRLVPYYEPDGVEVAAHPGLLDRIRRSDQQSRTRLEHIKQLLTQVLNVQWHSNGYQGTGNLDNGPELNVELSAARGSGHLLVSLTEQQPIATELPQKREDLIEAIIEHGWHDWCRPIMLEAENRKDRTLHRNTEMMVDHADVTTEHDIRYLARRFEDKHDPNQDYQPIKNPRLINLLQDIAANNPMAEQRPDLVTRLAENQPSHLTLTIEEDIAEAYVSIDLYQADERCVMISTIAGPEALEELTNERLLDLTLTANRRYDIVECLIDDDRNLVLRAVHPIPSLTKEELVFCIEAIFTASQTLTANFNDSQDRNN